MRLHIDITAYTTHSLIYFIIFNVLWDHFSKQYPDHFLLVVFIILMIITVWSLYVTESFTLVSQTFIFWVLEHSCLCVLYRTTATPSLSAMTNETMISIMTVSSAWWAGGVQVRNKETKWDERWNLLWIVLNIHKTE